MKKKKELKKMREMKEKKENWCPDPILHVKILPLGGAAFLVSLVVTPPRLAVDNLINVINPHLVCRRPESVQTNNWSSSPSPAVQTNVLKTLKKNKHLFSSARLISSCLLVARNG